jgi:hypothetical protein
MQNMSLDTATLQTSIKAAFKKAKDTPPPADPSQADQVQEKILTQLAQDLASALNTFVLGAEVIGVMVNVVNQSNQPIGTGTQAGAGKLQ